MLVGTYMHQGSYVTVAVEFDRADRPYVVLERQDEPGRIAARGLVELSSYRVALRHAERLLLLRGGLPGAEAETLASSPVAREVTSAMFAPGRRERFVFMAAPRPER